VRVPAGRMEVRNAIGILIRNADPLQVLLNHQISAPPIKVGEQKLVVWHANQPLANHCHKLRMKWKHGTLSILGCGRLDCQGRRSRI
jgi:hypothetical protein